MREVLHRTNLDPTRRLADARHTEQDLLEGLRVGCSHWLHCHPCKLSCAYSLSLSRTCPLPLPLDCNARRGCRQLTARTTARSIVVDDGTKKISYNLAQINVADGHDVCNACNCDLALLQLVPGESFHSLKSGQYVTLTYSSKAGPPPPPAPPPAPPGPHPPPPPPPPPRATPSFDVSGIFLQLADLAVGETVILQTPPLHPY